MKYKKSLTLFILFIFGEFLLQTRLQENIMAQTPDQKSTTIQVEPSYNQEDDETAPNQFLLPLVTPFLQNVVTQYNEQVGGFKKVDKVVLSEIFKSRQKQRESHFRYITNGPGVISFLRLYDNYNAQFVVQFLHIALPIFSNPSVDKSLLGKVNFRLDRVLRHKFVPMQEQYISVDLLQKLGTNDPTTFRKMLAPISAIVKDMSSYYELNDGFIKDVQKALEDKLKAYNIPVEKRKEIASTNLDLLIFTEILDIVQPKIKQQNQALFSNPTIGKELREWFKTAPAFNKHSIVGIDDASLNNLTDVLDSGRGFQFAIDISTKKSLERSGSPAWNPDVQNNGLELFTKMLENSTPMKIGNYTLGVIPESVSLSSPDKDIHIEFSVSNKDVLPSKSGQDSVEFGKPTQLPNPDSNIINDPTMEKYFEIPNPDAHQDGKTRVLSIKTYNRILGKHQHTNISKTFESSTKETPAKTAHNAAADTQSTSATTDDQSDSPPSNNSNGSQENTLASQAKKSDEDSTQNDDAIQEELSKQIQARIKEQNDSSE